MSILIRQSRLDKALVWARLRRTHLEHLDFEMQFVPCLHRPWPAKLVEADPYDAGGGLELALDQEPYGEGRRVPPLAAKP
jgi:hypothetical protein